MQEHTKLELQVIYSTTYGTYKHTSVQMHICPATPLGGAHLTETHAVSESTHNEQVTHGSPTV